MALTRTEVDHIAELARLGLTDEEKDRLARQLSAILDHFQVLQTLDTGDVPPTTTAVPLQNVMAEDSVNPSMDREDILVNAPDRVDEFFRVRAILD